MMFVNKTEFDKLSCIDKNAEEEDKFEDGDLKGNRSFNAHF